MQAMKNFQDNIGYLMESFNMTKYREISALIGVKENTIKSFLSENRYISIRMLDLVADNLHLPSYFLIKKNTYENFKEEYEMKYGLGYSNDSSYVLAVNLKRIFIDRGKTTWKDREALFFGFFGESALMSYTRDKNRRVPSLGRISLMAECLGIQVEFLIKEDIFNEKDCTNRIKNQN